MSSSGRNGTMNSQPRRRWLAGSSVLIALLAAGCGQSQQPPAASAAPSAAAETRFKTVNDGVLTVCLYGKFLPFAGQDDKGAWSGWDYTYLQDFAKKHAARLEVYVAKDFKGIWNLPGEGKCDIAGTGISVLPERQKDTEGKADWTNNYYFVQRSFAVDGKASIKGLDDLKGKKVYVTEGSTADLDLTNRIHCEKRDADDFDIVRNNDEGGDADQVLAGCAFAYGGGYGSILYLTKDTPLKADWTHDYMDTNCQPGKEPFSFVVSKKSTGLLNALNDFIGNGGPGYPGNQPNPDPGKADHQKVTCD